MKNQDGGPKWRTKIENQDGEPTWKTKIENQDGEARQRTKMENQDLEPRWRTKYGAKHNIFYHSVTLVKHIKNTSNMQEKH